MRIHTLDSLRGIFALMVVLLHFPAAWTFLNHPLVRNDGISVDFFFVLSGFVVSMIYARRLQTGADLGVFLIKRLGRIWPLHAFVLMLILGLDIVRYIASRHGLASDEAFFGQAEYWPVFLQDLFFLNAFRTIPSFHLNFPAWSIGAEFWTYVLFGLLVLWVRSFALTAAVVMAGCLLVLTGVVDPGFGQAFGWALFRSVFFFLVGYFTWRLWVLRGAQALPLPTVIETGIAAAVVLAIIYRRELPLSPVCFAVLFSAAIFVFSFQAGAISRLLMTRPMRILGERSYSIYLLHILVMAVTGITLRIAGRVFDTAFYIPGEVAGEPIDLLFVGSTFGTNLAVLAMLALIILLSGFTYRWIEKPGQRLAARLAIRHFPDRAEDIARL
jgi:peptidoglycan/LPS O-acetylase OafA/YrhL